MITRIELDGFKTFQDFKLDLSPFQVIVGPNGAGKSNLFDALHLLMLLAEEENIHDAFPKLRGDPIELFTTFSNRNIVNKMSLAVELLLNRYIEDSGVEAELKYTRMRYELEISHGNDEQGLEQLYVSYESLKTIPRKDDIWCKRHGLLTQKKWLPNLGVRGKRIDRYSSDKIPFISTDQSAIHLHPDGSARRIFSIGNVSIGNDRTMLSRGISIERPHVFAAREEIRRWKFLQLNPEVLREPSPMHAPASLSAQGHNLAKILARMQAEDPFFLNDVSADLAYLVPGVQKVEVDTDQARNQYIVKVRMLDEAPWTSRVLSDGTLRMLALATLKNDPEHHGVLCLEEPENGIHPSRLQSIAHVIRDLATNFQDEDQVNLPLRQLLVNTHSPTFISQTEIRDVLLFAYMVTRMRPPAQAIPPQRVTCIVPVIKHDAQLLADLGISEEEEAYTLDQIKDYLSSDSLNDAVHDIVPG